ncbi:hypothetical protein [Leptospira vanthielii]|uniref:Uncharacterized protein n=1 Tax=Leptospira vanthielii serovar Holland str. Waz Holland = ATCC 700522 TaxID=1218591 RepID=N1VZ83_9LEPT|nr:hypothetical protein [Leptospira vanthielii]EMY68063.1 hypothetical protein LEP1GSC199_3929 [Leptospira vanthielii serovar Holland str. Waz Holland = ATCC 700522]
MVFKEKKTYRFLKGIIGLLRTEDGKEGVKSSLEKCEPIYLGK